MSDTEDPFDNMSREDLLRLLKRANFVSDQLGARVGALFKENTELIGVIQDLQAEMQQLRASSNGEGVSHPEVLADVTS